MERSEYEGKLAAQRAEIDLAIEEFARQRESYFEGVEMEIVNLSLSIAHKILHREAQMDPLLLRGAVRLALERLEANTQVRLRVPAGRGPFVAPAFVRGHGRGRRSGGAAGRAWRGWG